MFQTARMKLSQIVTGFNEKHKNKRNLRVRKCKKKKTARGKKKTVGLRKTTGIEVNDTPAERHRQSHTLNLEKSFFLPR